MSDVTVREGSKLLASERERTAGPSARPSEQESRKEGVIAALPNAEAMKPDGPKADQTPQALGTEGRTPSAEKPALATSAEERVSIPVDKSSIESLRPEGVRQAPKPRAAKATISAEAGARADAKRPSPDAEAKPPKTAERDPIVDLMEKMQRASLVLGDRDVGLVSGIKKLTGAMDQPGELTNPRFRTQVAYVVQDMEKLTGTGIPMPPELRAEMTHLAATSPGLENKQMEALVRSTPEIADRGLVRDLRRAAGSIATLGQDQNSEAVQRTIEMLENRVRLAPRVTAASEGQAVPTERSGPTRANPSQAAGRPREEAGAEQPSPRTAAADATIRPPGKPAEAPAERGDTGVAARDAPESARTTASPGDQQRGEKPAEARQTEPRTTDVSVGPHRSHPKSAMGQIMDNLRSPTTSKAPPWAPSPVAMSDRVSHFQEKLDHGRTDQLIRASEKSGVAFMKSLETFASGPGAEVLGKIESAASTETGGMKAVMRGMQPGGRYAELRAEFDNALQSDRVFAAAYSQVEKTGAQYGKDRLTLGADSEAKRLDARQLDARFQTADAAIGEATEKIPGRTPGKSAMEELGEKVAEIVAKAVEKVRTMFGREAGPEAKASASPAMTP